MSWTDAANDLDGGDAFGGVWASDRDEFVGVGDGAGTETVVTSPDGIHWTLRTCAPFDGSSIYAICRDLFHGIYIAVGPTYLGNSIGTSPDAVTWTGAGDPFGADALCVAAKPSNGVSIVTAVGAAADPIARSTDGVTWSAVAGTPFVGGDVSGIDYSPGADLWMAAGASAVCISSDDGLTWAPITTPIVSFNGFGQSTVYRDEDNGRWWLLGDTTGGFSAAYSDDDGSTWTEVSTPLDPAGAANAIINCSGTLALGGRDAAGVNQMCASNDLGATWALDSEAPDPFGAAASAYALAYSGDRAVVFGGP